MQTGTVHHVLLMFVNDKRTFKEDKRAFPLHKCPVHLKKRSFHLQKCPLQDDKRVFHVVLRAFEDDKRVFHLHKCPFEDELTTFDDELRWVVWEVSEVV